jgi:hypothetical protein
MDKKIYVGSGKQAPGYDLINISVCLTDLPKGHIFEYKGSKYIKLTVAKRKEPDQYGKTHSVSVDTFKPQKEQPSMETLIADNQGVEAGEALVQPEELPF